jgi:hypothetical protein
MRLNLPCGNYGAIGMPATIVMTCPSTGKQVSTGIMVDSETFKELVRVGTQVRCPVCNQIHAWSKDARVLGLNVRLDDLMEEHTALKT